MSSTSDSPIREAARRFLDADDPDPAKFVGRVPALFQTRAMYWLRDFRGERYVVNGKGEIEVAPPGLALRHVKFDDSWIILGMYTTGVENAFNRWNDLKKMVEKGPVEGYPVDIDHGTKREWGNPAVISMIPQSYF